MALNIISTPNKTIGTFNSDSVSLSQVLYQLRREDYQADSFSATGNNITLNSAEGDVTSEFSAGDKIYLGGSEANSNVYTVASATTGGPNTIIYTTESIPVTDTGSGLFVNNLTTKDGYYVAFRFSEFNDKELYFIPNFLGEVFADIKNFLSQVIDVGGSQTQPYYQERYLTGEGTEQQFTDPIFVTFAKRQLLDNGGANIGELCLQPSPYGKNLSLFADFLDNYPKTWKNWARYVSYLNQDYSAVTIDQEWRDINNTFSRTVTAINLTPTPPNTIRQLLEPAENALDTEYFLQVEAGAPSRVSEFAYYQICDECKNPVMIEWLNYNGAYDQYLFNLEQSVTDVADSGLKYIKAIDNDIENITETKARDADKQTQFMTLKAYQLTQTDLQALHDIKQSREVRLWLTKDGTEYINVVVNSAYDTSFTTGKSNYEFALNIEMPDNFDFFKAKKY